jgi:hypothetical protein
MYKTWSSRRLSGRCSKEGKISSRRTPGSSATRPWANLHRRLNFSGALKWPRAAWISFRYSSSYCKQLLRAVKCRIISCVLDWVTNAGSGEPSQLPCSSVARVALFSEPESQWQCCRTGRIAHVGCLGYDELQRHFRS